MAELSKSTADGVQGEIFCLQEMLPNYDGLLEEDTLSIYKATLDPDTIYIHESMKYPDVIEFRRAI